MFGNVGALKHAKRKNPQMILGLCGCMMQQSHIAERVKKSFPYVDLVFGTHVLHELPENLYEALTSGHRVFDLKESDGVIAEHLPFAGTERSKPGCRSCTAATIFALTASYRMCADGNVRVNRTASSKRCAGWYRRALRKSPSWDKTSTPTARDWNTHQFSELLRWINAIDGDFRIRFMTSHPKDATHELIDTMAACEKVCNHLHLPVQSGSDRILKLMNRHYDRKLIWNWWLMPRKNCRVCR